MKVIALLAITSLCAQARKWVIEVDGAPEIFAVGDAHGDYVRLTTVLRAVLKRISGITASRPGSLLAMVPCLRHV